MKPSLSTSRFSISLRDVTSKRLAGVDCHELKTSDGTTTHQISVAVPASYAEKPKRRYSLVVLINACDVFGSAVEMSRLMAQTREIEECIVVCLQTPIVSADNVRHHSAFITSQLLSWCRDNYRVASGLARLFSGLAGTAEAVVRNVGADALQALPSAGDKLNESDPVLMLVNGLRRHLGTGHQYGSELLPLGNPFLSNVLGALRPLFNRLRSGSAAAATSSEYVIRAQQMKRDFEVFAVLPASVAVSSSRRYSTLLVLDANIELSTVAEAAARMARHGEIEEIMVIGIGIPRSEGIIEFGFRRFEEFAPPPDGYRFDDRLGRIFRSLFATRGQDARQCIGKASQLYSFLIDELLPTLMQQLPIDENKLGILGHSAGGTFATYTLCQERSPFRNYAIISPGVGMSGSWLMRDSQASRPLASGARQAFFAVGGDEITNHFCQVAGIPETEALSCQVKKQQPGMKVHFQYFEGETHSTIYPRAVAEALRSIYSAES
ncbi:MAG: alpha/beta hydrolase-fold protein [Pseudomonadota bacterium]